MIRNRDRVDEELNEALAKVNRLLAEISVTTGQLTDILVTHAESEGGTDA